MQAGDRNHTYINYLHKACFQHDMAFGKYKDLERGAQSDKVLKYKSFELANNLRYDGHQRGLAYKFFDKNSKGSGIKSIPNQPLANKTHKPIIRKFF